MSVTYVVESGASCLKTALENASGDRGIVSSLVMSPRRGIAVRFYETCSTIRELHLVHL
jgi:hypothetical protein